MTVYYQDDQVTLHWGDILPSAQSQARGIPDAVMATLPDASIDAVVCDPPYGISFMGRQWDQPGQFGSARGDGGPRGGHANTRSSHDAMAAGSYDLSPHAMRNFQSWCEAWALHCLRILKPGGHLLASGSSRTWHRLATGIEDAGFELRDSMAWLHGQGLPKSKNVGDGRGTALKPAFEPIVVARKPFRGSVTANVLEYGTGALNVDACRVGEESRTNTAGGALSLHRVSRVEQGYRNNLTASVGEASNVTGRWPTNVLLDDVAAAELDRQSGIRSSGTMRAGTERQPRSGGTIYGADARNFVSADTYGDSGGASRFFPTFRYEAKAPASERPSVNGLQHPTVKPLELMRWLVRLVTSPGGVVLDPFGGSGTTAEACVLEHRGAVLIEREPDYLPLIVARLSKPLHVGFDFEGTA